RLYTPPPRHKFPRRRVGPKRHRSPTTFGPRPTTCPSRRRPYLVTTGWPGSSLRGGHMPDLDDTTTRFDLKRFRRTLAPAAATAIALLAPTTAAHADAIAD